MSRWFVACPLAQDVAGQIEQWLALSGLGQLGRPINPSLWHLTLAFLGEVAEADQKSVGQLLSAMPALPPTTLVLDRLGVFGNVLWLGPTQVPDALRDWQAGLQRGLLQAGWLRENRPWIPHVSLLRRLQHPDTPLQVRAPVVDWPLESALLYQSSLLADGPVYEPLMRLATGPARLLPP